MANPVIEQVQRECFCDRFGKEHKLVSGHRDKLKPGWQRMLLDDTPPASDAEIARELEGVSDRMKLARRVMGAFNASFDVKDALIVGCGDLVEPMFVASAGAASVVGADRAIAGECKRTTQIAKQQLSEYQQPIPSMGAIKLCQDDIAKSSLPDKSFDLVCSWRTLEHITNPRDAFAEMHRVLRPGGFAYHEYNPFFAIDGGHSLVTLDVPWSHVRFDRDDIAEYLKQFRPKESNRALNYFDNCLNRMTLADLKKHATSTGFETLAVIPRTRTEDLIKVNANLMVAAQRNHPTITLNDLISRIVRVVLRRPSN